MYLFMLILIKVFLVLKSYLVKVFVSLVFFMLVGFMNMKLVMGRFGLESFVFERRMAFVTDFIVMFWLMIFWWSICSSKISLFFLDCWSLDKGMFVYLFMILVMLSFVIFLRSKEILDFRKFLSFFLVFFNCRRSDISVSCLSLVVRFKLNFFLVVFISSLILLIY